jgi:hypothetical protein
MPPRACCLNYLYSSVIFSGNWPSPKSTGVAPFTPHRSPLTIDHVVRGLCFEKYYESAILLRLALLPPPATNPIDFDPKPDYSSRAWNVPFGGRARSPYTRKTSPHP